MSKPKNKLERIYFKHEYLAEYYASKIFNESNIGLEKEDIVQELKMKLWTSIKSYLERWKKYKETDTMKPIPIKFYLRTALMNKSKDFYKEIGKVDMIPMSSINFDYGTEDSILDIDFQNKSIKIEHTDILEGLSPDEKKFFMLYLKGFSISKINKIYKGKLNPKVCMQLNIEKIRKLVPQVAEETNDYKIILFDE